MQALPSGNPQDRRRVNVEDSRELKFWCRELRCEERQLRAAVARVGVLADDVRRALVWGATSL